MVAFELEGVVLAGVPARWPWRYHMPATVGMADRRSGRLCCRCFRLRAWLIVSRQVWGRLRMRLSRWAALHGTGTLRV